MPRLLPYVMTFTADLPPVGLTDLIPIACVCSPVDSLG